MIADLSGSQAQNANPLSAGLTAALKSANASGGVKGAQFDITTIDAMTSPQGTQAAVRQVSASKPAAVVFGASASELAVAGPMFDSNPSLTVVSGTILDKYVTPKPASWFFSIAQPSGSTAKQVVGGLQQVLGSMSGKRIELVGLQNPAVDEGLAAMKKLIEANGGQVIGTEHDTAGMTSFASQAANIAAKKPDGVIIYSSVDNTIIDAQALVTAGVKTPIVTSDAAADTTVFKKVNASNFYATRVYREPAPGDMFTKAAQKYGVGQYAPTAYFGRGWTIGQVLIKAFTACGVPCKDLPGAIEGLGTVQLDSVLGTDTFSKDKHYGADQAQLFGMKDGKPTAVGQPYDIKLDAS
ncbi:ABC transporter substrate-binding protein [Jatrophihabitans cynanchi]|uniref:ABC transporter substrate-binding protein n=1 Tax=Jatrophihabitans cynanchi TaxID=2944128 RepID=A0ABY7K0K7_9ACTN|nr:ABC transporter substrate-binding protein [Jatrophihabitans sp. SB3-54]